MRKTCRCAVFLFLLLGVVSCRRAPSRPNILFLSIDTLRADRIGYTGYGRPTTPNLDRFAREAYRFTDVLAQAPSTWSSHRSLFTSLYPSVHKQGQSRQSSSIPYSMASILRDNGYHTAGFVDGGYLRAAFGFGHGFDLYDDDSKRDRPRVGIGRLGLAGINPKVRAWFEAKPKQPFFLFVHTYDVHCPYTPPEPYFGKFSGWYKGVLQVQGECGASFNGTRLSDEDYRYLSDLYDGGIAYMDNQLEALFRIFRDAGLFDDMMVIVTSDHGESLGERGYVGHNRQYDEELQIPLVWRVPGHAGGVVREPSQSIDILPTMCSILGIDPRIEMQGKDLLSCMQGEASFEGTRMRMSEGTFGHALRFDDRFKIVLRKSGSYELFDLRRDPGELATVNDDGVAKEMLGKYRAWYKQNRPLYDRFKKTVKTEVDEETKEQLEELGYAGDE
ncbi:MAG: sulfatase [Acidobacteria bacterium]|nr:sulfatase [Acidobacteriota bacterium]